MNYIFNHFYPVRQQMLAIEMSLPLGICFERARKQFISGPKNYTLVIGLEFILL